MRLNYVFRSILSVLRFRRFCPDDDIERGGKQMKRVKAGCILQTLVFMQKEDCGFSKESQLKYNRDEVEKYKNDLEKNKTRYQIVSVEEQEDASIIVRVKKHLNNKTDVSEYWN